MAGQNGTKAKKSQNFEKAQLAIDKGPVIHCLFNPTEFTITKTNTWKGDPKKGVSLPKVEFAGGNPRELSLSLLLDASLAGPDGSVRKDADALFQMMEVPKGAPKGKEQPPLVEFRWGVMQTFKAACTSLTVTYQLFQPDGEPIRADVKLALKQAEISSTASSKGANKKTNPTTQALEGMSMHTVIDGDSLPSIAFRAYNDPTRWRTIAEANGIDDPLRLRRGASLVVPPPDA